ncbi:ankyrin repeat domain-containing protein [Rickettsia endosymbiont of Urophora cardui]|uniref:ankyrin repeat domain-containing protein n=1 Tax=Rickettsia endosymbiont of Urophora cardui TaxID=3066265 RepID=UPI00313B24A3
MHKDIKLLDEIKNIKSKLKSGKPAVAPKPTPKQIKAWEETHKSPLNLDTKNSSIPVPPPMPDHVLLQTSKTPSVSTLPNIKFNTINQAKFLKAIEDYDLDKIKELISSNTIKIDSFGKRGRLSKTPLQYAIINDKPELAKLLIDAGANINVKTQNGSNLFELAMYNSASDQTFELLLKTNININSMDLRALSRLHNKLFSILLKPANDINTTIGKFNRTLLHQAAERNNIKKAQMLINHNINVEAQDITGETALHMLKTSKMAKILLKVGSNTEAQNKLGRTPLHNAILQANKRQVNIKNIHNIVLKLIKSGANPNAVDYYGFTPLEYAIRINDSKIFKLLIKNNAKFKKIDMSYSVKL